MSWKLWLEDQLDDPDAPARHTPAGFIGAKSSTEAIELTLALGSPAYVDFDHDLGGDDTAKVYLKWLYQNYPDSPPEYHIHSANNQGAQWIQSYIDSWKRSLIP